MSPLPSISDVSSAVEMGYEAWLQMEEKFDDFNAYSGSAFTMQQLGVGLFVLTTIVPGWRSSGRRSRPA